LLIHDLLRHVRAAGFDGVPEPIGIDPDGRERLGYIEGDVPCPPYPAWFQTDRALASTAALLSRFHAAAAGFVAPAGTSWHPELADPQGGPVVCHNDVCPENVVFRDGEAVALLDFDFAAPGRAVFDLAMLAKLCVPIDTPEGAAPLGWNALDVFRRLRVAADAYGLVPERDEFVRLLEEVMLAGEQFVRGRIERGEPAFVQMWETMGGQARYERRRVWFARHRCRFLEALS
jgi:hypothetical protein